VDEYVRRVRSEGLKQLRRVIDEDWKGLRAEAVAKIGSPEAEILNEARGFHADLIVMGNRGLSLIERLSLGSVAERTVQGASCPVLVAKQTGSAGELIA
jgi:nucleotide-binding universal stress UspA family protein